MTAAELNPELRNLIDTRLEAIDRILLRAETGWSERRSIVDEVETQIYELLARRGPAPSEADVLAVRNDFFGPAITVAGLLTGQDVAQALTAHPPGDVVLLPRVALTETKGVFLDDVAPDDLARHVSVPVVTLEASARGLVEGNESV